MKYQSKSKRVTNRCRGPQLDARFFVWSSVLVGCLSLTGCGGEKKASVEMTGSAATRPTPLNVDTTAPGPPPPGGKSVQGNLTEAQLQEQLRNFADHYRLSMAYACDYVAHQTNDPLIQRRVHDLKIDGATAMYDIVIDPVPATALLNTLVMSSLQAHVLDTYAAEYFGPGGKVLVKEAREIEEEAWRIGARVMTGEQRQALMNMCIQWWEKNEKPGNIFYVRLDDFAAASGNPVRGMVGQLTSMPAKFLDNFIPVNRAGETLGEAQVLAERMSWLTPRLMILAQWRAEAIIYEALATSQVRDALDVANTVANAVTVLPAQIEEQRKALFTDIRESQPQISKLLEDAQATIVSVQGVADDALTLTDRSTELLASADQLVMSVDGVVARIEKMQAAQREAAEKNPSPPSTQPSRPFDITEYTQAINAANDALKQVESVISSAEQASTPDQLNSRVEVIRDAASGLIWLLGGVLGGAALIVVLVAKLIPSRKRR